jgi:hypothetical protein
MACGTVEEKLDRVNIREDVRHLVGEVEIV